MIDLTNSELRVRDIRKLVEPRLYQVTWDDGLESGNEWQYINAKNHISWLKSKNINENVSVIATDKSWSKLDRIYSDDLVIKLDEFVRDGFSLFVSANRGWVIDFNLNLEVARFGYWR